MAHKNIAVVIAIALPILTALGIIFFNQSSRQSKPATQLSVTPQPTNLVGGDVDEHGCLGSAGYSWCQIKQKCLRAWEEPCDSIPSDLDSIKSALVAKHNWNPEDITLTISQNDGVYASGGVGSTTSQGGGLWFAAKVNGTWEIVFDGNGIITCADVVNYPDFPKTLIPQCYDSNTDQLITR